MIANPSDNIGPKPGLCLCYVIRLHNADPISGYPPNVNYAVALSYDVIAETPNGQVEFKNVTPMLERWPRPWVVEGFRDTSPEDGDTILLPGAIMDGTFYLMVREERWAAPCGWTPTIPLPTPPPANNLPPTTTPPGDVAPPGAIPTEPPPMLAPPGPPRLDYPGVGP